MKRSLVFLAILLLVSFASLALASNEDFSTSEWVPGHLMVNFVQKVGTLEDMGGYGKAVALGIPSVDALFAKYHVTEMRRVIDDKTIALMKVQPDFFRFVLLLCPPETDILAMMREFELDPNVDTADPDLLRHECTVTPNDALWASQWDKLLMNCPTAWQFGTGSRDIQVIAIDTGTDWRHPDLRANLWVNPGEDINGDHLVYTDTSYPGDVSDTNGIDDDDDGRIDDLIGWDFINGITGCWPGEDCSTPDNNPFGLEDHGTHVAGLMGAVGNNAMGVAGVNWNVTIMASRAGYKSSDGNGLIPQSASFPCIAWAVSKGAKVINMSYGGTSGGGQEGNVMASAWNNGAILVAAAGNDNSPSVHYPAGYPDVESVGSVDVGDIVSSFSDYGNWVDIFSPGGGVISTVLNGGYANYEGTSMASPNAAGVFALIWSMFPSLTNQELVDLINSHCRDIYPENVGNYSQSDLGNGRIDAMLAVASQFPYMSVTANTISGDNDNDGRLESGETGMLTVTLHNDSAWAWAQDLHVEIATVDPNLTITNGGFDVGTMEPGSDYTSSDHPVQISCASGIADAYWSTITLNCTGFNDFHFQTSFTLRIGRPQTLLVADDGSSAFHTYFQSGLWHDSSGFNYDLWSSPTLGSPTWNDIHQYNIIVWVCGNESSNTLSPNDQTMLQQFLDGGGRLLLAGQNIDGDISGTSFYSDYLHCQSGQAVGERNLTGVDGDPISGGTRLLLLGGSCGGNGTVHPSQIVPINGGIGFYSYNSGGVGAVRYSNDQYKVAYFAFAIEAACGLSGTAYYGTVLNNVMNWFGANYTADVPNPTGTVPADFALKGNYPNPFNPTTTIAFDLATSAHVTLNIYNTMGQHVATLLDEPMPAGSHTAFFNGSNLASGVYLARLQAGTFEQTKRMVLLK